MLLAMEEWELAELNAHIDDLLRITNSGELAQLTIDVCQLRGLVVLEAYDGSGVLFQDPKTKRCCFAWENGYVDNQIDDPVD